MSTDEIVRALRCKECFDLCNVESCRYHLTNTKSGCKCAIKLMANDAADALEAADRRITELEAAVEDMTAVLKRDSDDICAYCKNRVECESQQCEKYSSGVGDVDGNYPDWKWTCMDFAYGTCSLLADTPCNGCFDDDCKGFEWRGQHAGEENR